MDQESISETQPQPSPVAGAAALTVTSVDPVAQTSPTPSLRSNRNAKRALRNSRVHFDEEILPVEDNPVVVKVIGEELSRTVEVYLGFLQEDHKYEVVFAIPRCYDFLVPGPNPNSEEASLSSPVEIHKSPVTCTIQKIEWSRGMTSVNGMSLQSRLMISMELQLSNHSMPVFDDKFSLRSNSAPDRFLHVLIAAKIMGKHMGTPSLKDGIKCIGHCPAPVDSDSSDAEGDRDRDQNQKKPEPQPDSSGATTSST